MTTCFISDLHLNPEKPWIVEGFFKFLQSRADQLERLYLLGDLFEYWIGDDAAAELSAEPVLDAMAAFASRLDCYFVAGNRDFLIGEEFEKRTGFKLLDDETVIDLYGTKTLILHGDSMCTDDHAHIQFRQNMVTNSAWRAQFLSLPIAIRIQQAMMARQESNKHKQNISMEIMDVNEDTVEDTFNKYSVTQMIHGHTHRQKKHEYEMAGEIRTRYVLGDWHHTSSALFASPDGSISIENLPLRPTDA